MAETKPTRADRLEAVLAKVAPKAAEYHRTHGVWPHAGEEDPPAKRREQLAKKLREEIPDTLLREAYVLKVDLGRRHAPYQFEPIEGDASDRIRLRVSGDDGSVHVGLGKDAEEALAALEAKLS